jgi:glutamate carboxypeptidase
MIRMDESMAGSIRTILDWVDQQRGGMVQRVARWAGINSYSFNVEGLNALADVLEGEFSALGGEARRHELRATEIIDARGQVIRKPLGPAIRISKRAEAPLRILLNIHMDTVYPPQSGAGKVEEVNGKLVGAGVADAKGGLAVMLTALEALERSEQANRIGWTVFINPDEEIGSPGSAGMLAEMARDHHFGLLFEPALPDGALVDQRRGSGNFSIIVRGRSAHAGRDFASGRSALLAAAKISLELHAINETVPGVTVNIGSIDGGSPANVVPDLAICRVNIRTTEPVDEKRALGAVEKSVAELNRMEGISAELRGQFASPPKVLDDRTQRLLDAIISCGRDLGLSLASRASGGASDGNRLAAAGLPNIDSLGVRGDRIHSSEEYLIPESLPERAQLTALLMLKIAAGDIDARGFCR